jgi:hypothetical protein
MSANAYKLLGFVVWRGGKWYLRKRLPSPRTVALAAAASVSGAAAVTLIARRITA